MKNLIVMVPFLCLSLSADLSVEKIEKMVKKIQQRRDGFDLKTLSSVKDPFFKIHEDDNVTVYASPKAPKGRMDLHALMGNKAYINDGWKEINSTVLGYTLKYIGKKSVVLSNGNHMKKLFLPHDKNNFITTEER